MATQTPAATAQSTTTAAPPQQEFFPSAGVLLQAAKLALMQDKPILLDFYVDTAKGKAIMAQDVESKEKNKMLVRSLEEYTSIIQKTYKVGTEYIVMTENSIYITHGNMQTKGIKGSTLKRDD